MNAVGRRKVGAGEGQSPPRGVDVERIHGSWGFSVPRKGHRLTP
jgi:hypothetical protein